MKYYIALALFAMSDQQSWAIKIQNKIKIKDKQEDDIQARLDAGEDVGTIDHFKKDVLLNATVGFVQANVTKNDTQQIQSGSKPSTASVVMVTSEINTQKQS